MNPEVKKLEERDLGKFIELIQLFGEVFERADLTMPEENYLQQLLRRDDFFVFAALLDQKVVGGITAYVLQQYYSKQPLVYIYDVAVQTEFQGGGIGKKLMQYITNYAKEAGAEEVYVQADADDEGAIRFYHATGAKAQKVVHFNYLLGPK